MLIDIPYIIGSSFVSLADLYSDRRVISEANANRRDPDLPMRRRDPQVPNVAQNCWNASCVLQHAGEAHLRPKLNEGGELDFQMR